MPAKLIPFRVLAQEAADDGSNLAGLFFDRRMQSCGALELAGQLVDLVVVGGQQDQRVMRIDVRFVGVAFDMRDMIEIRYSCSSTLLPSGKIVTLVGTP